MPAHHSRAGLHVLAKSHSPIASVLLLSSDAPPECTHPRSPPAPPLAPFPPPLRSQLPAASKPLSRRFESRCPPPAAHPPRAGTRSRCLFSPAHLPALHNSSRRALPSHSDSPEQSDSPQPACIPSHHNWAASDSTTIRPPQWSCIFSGVQESRRRRPLRHSAAVLSSRGEFALACALQDHSRHGRQTLVILFRRSNRNANRFRSVAFVSMHRVTCSLSSSAASAAACATPDVLNGVRNLFIAESSSGRPMAYPMRNPANPYTFENVRRISRFFLLRYASTESR